MGVLGELQIFTSGTLLNIQKMPWFGVFFTLVCHFFAFTPFKYTHNTNFEEKKQSWLGFFVHPGGSNFLSELREGRHRLLN